jgi:hypothetical protein
MIPHAANQTIAPNVRQSSQAIALTMSGCFCCHGRRRSTSTLYRRRGRKSPRRSTKFSKRSRGRIGGFRNKKRAMSRHTDSAATGLPENSIFSGCALSVICSCEEVRSRPSCPKFPIFRARRTVLSLLTPPMGKGPARPGSPGFDTPKVGRGFLFGARTPRGREPSLNHSRSCSLVRARARKGLARQGDS